MSNFLIYYMDLTPDLENQFDDLTHQVVMPKLRTAFPNWTGFHNRFAGYDLGIVLVTKRGIDALQIKGPSVSRKSQTVDFSIFLPEKIEFLDQDKKEDVGNYLDLLFSGLETVLTNYDVKNDELMSIKNECKNEWNLKLSAHQSTPAL